MQKHMYAVEAAVRHYARQMGEDEELWGLAGLLHDVDWERHPDEHPRAGVAALRKLGYPEEVVHAIEVHVYPDRTDVVPESQLDRVLYACDELSGLVYACCLVRPNGIDDLKPKSVAKKLKDKAFARGVHRDAVHRGIELIGLPRAEHIQNVIEGMRAVADVLEVRGEDQAGRQGEKPVPVAGKLEELAAKAKTELAKHKAGAAVPLSMLRQALRRAVEHYSDESVLKKLAGLAAKVVKSGKRVLLRVLCMALVLYYCLKDPDTPLRARRIVTGALGYLILPVDAVPDFLPLVGLTDDLAMLAAAFAIVLVHIKPEHRRAAKEKMEEYGAGEDVCGEMTLPHADEP